MLYSLYLLIRIPTPLMCEAVRFLYDFCTVWFLLLLILLHGGY